MTIYLPQKAEAFRQTLDDICNQILSHKNDTIFYARISELVLRLREHSLLESFFLDLEAMTAEKKQTFNTATLEALEDWWTRLWKYHRHSLNHRKQLIHVKWIVTKPREISYSTLYKRISWSMCQFQYLSPLCRGLSHALELFSAAQSKRKIASTFFDYFYPSMTTYFSQKKISRFEIDEKDKEKSLPEKIFTLYSPNHIYPKRFAEQLPWALISPKLAPIENKPLIPGRDNYEKQRSILDFAAFSCLAYAA